MFYILHNVSITKRFFLFFREAQHLENQGITVFGESGNAASPGDGIHVNFYISFRYRRTYRVCNCYEM
ncbi:unnamed protein product [Callosobruchus maculatus]|uniref:Uncharacterized protein n=1 Tax=Callosobruchus maculatus TaxID=64391 RepID=A0A653D9J9_CALMS|nr:unnamed protein product [Callosobruchus maculatus]